MGFSEVLRLIIDADAKGAVREVQRVGKATDKELGKSQKTIDKWSRGLTNAGVGMVALGGAALFGLGKAAKASEEAHLSVVKLENTLTNMPRLAGENSKSFIDLANAIQDKTAADADQIIEAQALLGTFQVTGKEIRGITPLVVDLARKFGIDMTSAALQVGKALDGNVGALQRNGISIDKTLFATDRYAAVTKALRDQVGGFAEEEGKTFAGSLERLKNQMGDLAEGVGAGAVDAFSSLFGIVEGGVDKLNELSPAAQSAIGKIATFGSVALIAAGGLSFMIGQAIKMRTNFEALGTAVASARLRFASLGGVIGPLGVGAALLAASSAFALYLKQQNEAKIAAAAEAFAKLRDVTTESAAATLKLNDAVKVSTIDFTASRSAADEFAATGEITNEVMRDLDKAWGQIIEKSPQFAEGFINNAEKIGVSKDKLAEWRGELGNKIAADQEAIAATDEYNAAVQGTTEATEEATSALEEYSAQLQAMTDPIFAAMDAITGVRDAQLGEADAAAAVMEATVALNEARAGGNAAEIAEAERGLADAQRDLTDAQWATVESAAEADSALAGLTDAVANGDVSMAQFRDTLATWVGQGFLTQAQADAAADSVANLGGQAAEADKERVDIPVTTPGAPKSSSELRTVRDRALEIPSRRHTSVSVSGVGSAVGSLDSLARKLNNLPSFKSIGIRLSVGGGGGLIFHEGGVVPGRRGEEVAAVLQAGERVVSLQEQDKWGKAMAAGPVGGAGGYVDNRVFNITTGADPHSVVRAIRQAGDLGLPITIRGRRL
jgi:hypothetical protein